MLPLKCPNLTVTPLIVKIVTDLSKYKLVNESQAKGCRMSSEKNEPKVGLMSRLEEAWVGGTAEFLATFFFIILGAGTVVITGAITGGSLDISRLLAISLAHGIAIMLLVTATANISGGHINPAVTISMIITKNITITKGVIYIICQLAGGTLGALTLCWLMPEAGNLGSHGLGAGITAFQGLVTEIILTFALVFVIFASAVDPRGLGKLAPIAIGLTVMADHLVGVPLTGASMNPARSFGPALVSMTWDNHWIYWIGPIIGGILAATVYKLVFLNRR
jgi:aquaporin TIP